jgi:hypothetical protein
MDVARGRGGRHVLCSNFSEVRCDCRCPVVDDSVPWNGAREGVGTWHLAEQLAFRRGAFI